MHLSVLVDEFRCCYSRVSQALGNSIIRLTDGHSHFDFLFFKHFFMPGVFLTVLAWKHVNLDASAVKA